GERGRMGSMNPSSSYWVVGGYRRTSGATGTQTAAAATLPLASRYWVVVAGLIARLTAPLFVAGTRATSCHPVVDRCCSETSSIPRAMPESRAEEPYTTGPVGAASERTPTLNHVERRPSRRRRSPAATA